MSRKITGEAVAALLDKKPFKKSNMKVHMDFGGVSPAQSMSFV